MDNILHIDTETKDVPDREQQIDTVQQLVLKDTLNEDGKRIRYEEESAATTQHIRKPVTAEVLKVFKIV